MAYACTRTAFNAPIFASIHAPPRADIHATRLTYGFTIPFTIMRRNHSSYM